MAFDPNGSSPIIKIKFGGIDLGVCVIKFKKSSTDSWTTIINFNGLIANVEFDLEPQNLIGAGKSTKDFSGTSIGWFYVVADLDLNGTVDYSFDLDILQNNNVLKRFSQRGREALSSKLVSDKHQF